MTKYCILKTSALGDIVHCYKSLAYIKEMDEEAEITWVVEKRNAELVKRHPLVDRVIIVDTKKRRFGIRALRDTKYDAIFDFQGNIKSGLLLAFMRAKAKIGFKHPAEWPNKLFTNRRVKIPEGQNIRDDYFTVAKSYFGKEFDYEPTLLDISFADEEFVETLAKKGSVLVSPGARWKSKVLPLEKLLSFLDLNKKTLISWGTEEEKVLAEELIKVHPNAQILPKLTLPALQHLISRMDLFVGMDSLPLHLAAETGIETLSFFGPSLAAKYQPSKGTAHQFNCQENKTFSKRCPNLRRCSCLDF